MMNTQAKVNDDGSVKKSTYNYSSYDNRSAKMKRVREIGKKNTIYHNRRDKCTTVENKWASRTLKNDKVGVVDVTLCTSWFFVFGFFFYILVRSIWRSFIWTHHQCISIAAGLYPWLKCCKALFNSMAFVRNDVRYFFYTMVSCSHS